MDVDKKLMEKVLVTLTNIQVDIDFSTVGEFVQNFANICNRVFITLGRINGWEEVTLYDKTFLGILEIDGDGYTLYDRNKDEIFTFVLDMELDDYDEMCWNEQWFEYDEDDLVELSLNDIIKIQPIVVAAINKIKVTFNELNEGMEKINKAVKDIESLR